MTPASPCCAPSWPCSRPGAADLDPFANLAYESGGRAQLNRTAIRYGDVPRPPASLPTEGFDVSHWTGWRNYDNAGISLEPLMAPDAMFTNLTIDWWFLWVVRTKAGKGCWVWPHRSRQGQVRVVEGGPFRYVWAKVWAEIVSYKDAGIGGAAAAGKLIHVKSQGWRIWESMSFFAEGRSWNQLSDRAYFAGSRRGDGRTKWRGSGTTKV